MKIAIALSLVAVATAASATAQVVEREAKISSTSGGLPDVLANDDHFGCSISSFGDLDGDGSVDLAVGAFQDSTAAFWAGAVHVLFTNPDGTVRDARKITGSFGNFFGSGVAAISDLNGDGITDLAVGATNPLAGAVFLFRMSPEGDAVLAGTIAEGQGDFGGDLDAGDRFGDAVAEIGDLDGDGWNDLAVGAPFDDDGGSDRGAAWILFMAADTVVGWHKISDLEPAIAGSLDDGDRFGKSIGAPGDVDGDGILDIVVGAYADDDGGVNRGALYVLFLQPDGSVGAAQKISDTEGGFTAPLDDFESFGYAPTKIGDRDGDGVPDLAVGVWNHRHDTLGNTGAVYFLHLRRDGTVRDYDLVSKVSGGLTGPLDENDGFGSGVAAIGDADGDGDVDVAVGTMKDDDGGTDRGAVYMLYVDPPCRAGSVNSGAGPIASVLTANGLPGEVVAATNAPITVALAAPPAGAASGRYVTWVWASANEGRYPLVWGPNVLGCLVRPSPLQSPQLPQPIRCLRSPGLPNALCSGVTTLPSPPAVPWSVTKASGLSNPITLRLQGLVRDAGAGNATGYSVTNAVTIRVQ